jgi:hypothetical protein
MKFNLESQDKKVRNGKVVSAHYTLSTTKEDWNMISSCHLNAY